jgi:hypothetical protein
MRAFPFPFTPKFLSAMVVESTISSWAISVTLVLFSFVVLSPKYFLFSAF